MSEGNGLHEYFMGFGCPHIHNLFVLLEISCFMSHKYKNLRKCDVEIVKKSTSLSHAQCVIVFFLVGDCLSMATW